MKCENCGMDIPNEAVICTNCKTPTKNMTPELQEKMINALKQKEKDDKKEARAIAITIACVLSFAVITLIIVAIIKN